jgi:rhodanese-related sulfurtransferase
VKRSSRITVQALAERLEASGAPTVLDVRTPAEWNTAHIDGSVNIPLNRLQQRLAEVPRGVELAVICRSGYRSSIATSLLAGAGFGQLLDVVGGMEAWTRMGAGSAGAKA